MKELLEGRRCLDVEIDLGSAQKHYGVEDAKFVVELDHKMLDHLLCQEH